MADEIMISNQNDKDNNGFFILEEHVVLLPAIYYQAAHTTGSYLVASSSFCKGT